ncbi:MAG: 1,4-dihydroxy-2-naphthoate octaprenyltransferase [Chitinivibrionales bacterium]|nr:1,4-dihydroxy-2-naphthoate octaprenyltransferase [Chitinivibrionales bacterium]
MKLFRSPRFQALRAYSFPAMIVPIAAGAALSADDGISADWRLLPLILLSALAIHAGTNLVNDLEDFSRGVDNPEWPGSSGVLVLGLLTPRQIVLQALSCFAFSIIAALPLIVMRGWSVAALGVVGIVAGYSYTGKPLAYKYHALGDAAVFMLMGMLPVAGTYFVLTGSWNPSTLLIGIPIGCLVTAILHANNMRDIKHDSDSGFRTLAFHLGYRGSKVLFVALIMTAYTIPVLLALLRTAGMWSLLVMATAPMAFSVVRKIVKSSSENPRKLMSIDREIALLHMAFGIAFVFGIGVN